MTNQQWSKAVKDAAGNACQYCGSKNKLESHHILPRCDFPHAASLLINGVCLCHSCHVKAHGGTFYRPIGNPDCVLPGKYTKAEILAVKSFVASLRDRVNRAIEETIERDNENE